MLTALEQGVKGGKWFSLIDKVYSPKTLRAAFAQVKANRGAAGIDHQTIQMYESRLSENIQRASESLKSGRYQPRAVKRVMIPKPGKKEERPLGIPGVCDRVIQTALLNVLEPIFEKDFAEHSYGFRPGRGCKDALRRVDALLKAGHTWVVDADIKGYFDNIPHEPLMELISNKVSDGEVLTLVRRFLKQPVTDGTSIWTPEKGTPQGAVISPLLSNIYLDPLDHLMASQGYQMVRYADDFVILCRNEAEAQQALQHVQTWMIEAGLTLHPDKTRIVDAAERGGFDFLGYHFERGYRWPAKKSLNKFKESVRAKSKRTNGNSMQEIILDLNKTIRGWFEYFKHSHYTTFGRLDRWIRVRLRSVLRKRHGGRGRGHGRSQNRWPNAYFTGLGLFSMTAAWESVSQSLKR